MTVLATAYADPATGGSGEHEPMILTVGYGKGRVFHTPMGHSPEAMQCVGFITVLLRGSEWAATGDVTLTEIPTDFPPADKVSVRE
jgi:type 1 glutamine amidotransferase